MERGHDHAVDYKRSTANTAPTAAFTYSPSDPEVGEEIIFNTSESDDSDGLIVSYEWDFGDGASTTVSTQTVTHTYTAEGDYEVTLTVTDDDGAAASTSQTVPVRVFADPLEVDGETYLPEDRDGDGLYEEVNGDGELDKEDTEALIQIHDAYERGELQLTDEQVDAFDFDGDGDFDREDYDALEDLFE